MEKKKKMKRNLTRKGVSCCCFVQIFRKESSANDYFSTSKSSVERTFLMTDFVSTS